MAIIMGTCSLQRLVPVQSLQVYFKSKLLAQVCLVAVLMYWETRSVLYTSPVQPHALSSGRDGLVPASPVQPHVLGTPWLRSGLYQSCTTSCTGKPLAQVWFVPVLYNLMYWETPSSGQACTSPVQPHVETPSSGQACTSCCKSPLLINVDHIQCCTHVHCWTMSLSMKAWLGYYSGSQSLYLDLL